MQQISCHIEVVHDCGNQRALEYILLQCAILCCSRSWAGLHFKSFSKYFLNDAFSYLWGKWER